MALHKWLQIPRPSAQLLSQWKRLNARQGEAAASVHQRLCWEITTRQHSKWVTYSTAVTAQLNLITQESFLHIMKTHKFWNSKVYSISSTARFLPTSWHSHVLQATAVRFTAQSATLVILYISLTSSQFTALNWGRSRTCLWEAQPFQGCSDADGDFHRQHDIHTAAWDPVCAGKHLQACQHS